MADTTSAPAPGAQTQNTETSRPQRGGGDRSQRRGGNRRGGHKGSESRSSGDADSEHHSRRGGPRGGRRGDADHNNTHQGLRAQLTLSGKDEKPEQPVDD